MSFKIWFLALVLSMAMAISGIASGADSIGKNSISFNTASWCATPVFTTPSYTDIMPEIRIIGSHSKYCNELEYQHCDNIQISQFFQCGRIRNDSGPGYGQSSR